MTKLIPILIISIILITLAENRSEWTIDCQSRRVYTYKDSILLFILALCLATFVGLRIKGNDTGTYRYMYESTPATIKAFEINWTNLSMAPGLQFICACFRIIGLTTQNYLMIIAIFTIMVYTWFIRKYTTNISLSFFFFITMGVYGFTLAAIKQTTAMAILVIATDRILEKKYFRFLILIIIAELFHPYAFIYLIIPFLVFIPWSTKSWLLIGGTIICVLSFSRMMDDLLNITDFLGAKYTEEDFIQRGVSFFRVLVVWVPVLLSYLIKDQIKYDDNRIYNVFINSTMINAILMFIGLFGTANYFARLANYFLIFQVISLPYIIQHFDEKNVRFLTVSSIICYSLYYIYDEAIAQGGFDITYRFMSLGDFLRQIR